MRQYALTLISVTLMLLLFGSMYVAASTGENGWFIGVAVFDFLAILGFVAFAPSRWPD